MFKNKLDTPHFSMFGSLYSDAYSLSWTLGAMLYPSLSLKYELLVVRNDKPTAGETNIADLSTFVLSYKSSSS